MKVIKKINNNVVICLDNNDCEVVAFGKGIGFQELPYELTDLSLIDRTFYSVNSMYLGMINEIPEAVFKIAVRIVDMAANYLDCELNSNAPFILSDHINFAIERMQKNIVIKNPMAYDIQFFYDKEMELGMLAVKMIKRELNVCLPKEEVSNIALHIVNAELASKEGPNDCDSDVIIDSITRLIERELGFRIEKEDFNYSRFVSHLNYLIKRKGMGLDNSEEIIQMYKNMKQEFPELNQCVNKIAFYIAKTLQWELSEEELLYLLLHVNRLYAREDCNR